MHSIIKQLEIRFRDLLIFKGLFKLKSLEDEVLALTQIPTFELPTWVAHALKTRFSDHASDSLKKTVWHEVYLASKPSLLKGVAISTLCSLAASGASLAGVQILKLDPGSQLEISLLLAGVFFFCTLVNQYGVYLGQRGRNYGMVAVEGRLSQLIAAKLLRLSQHHLDPQITTGNLKVLLTSDVKAISGLLETALRNLIPALVALVVICPVILYYTGPAGGVAVLILFALLPISWGLNLISIWFQTRAMSRLDVVASQCGEWIKNARLMRMLGFEQVIEAKITRSLRAYMKYAVGLHWMACFTWGLSVSWWMLSITAMAYLFERAGSSITSAHSFWGAIWLITFLAGFLTQLPGVLRSYAEAMPAAKRIELLFKQRDLRDDFVANESSAQKFVNPTAVRVHLKSVSLVLGGSSVLDRISLSWDLNQRLAIVGEVGSGKSVLLSLLVGELKPTSGQVLVEWSDGTLSDLWSEQSYKVFRDQLSLVQQEVYVSGGSLGQNLTLEEQDSHEGVFESLQWAALEADLQTLPKGIQTVIGERGLNLSGGQRSRLALGRARFQLSPTRKTFVLDDVLSALDTALEKTVFEQLLNHEGGVLLVTHRVSLLLALDQVWVMSQGKIIEKGAPKSLFEDQHSHFKKVMMAYHDHGAN